MLEHIDPTAQEALSALENASDLQTLDQARVRYLGVNGQFTALLKQMGSLPKEDRPKAGVQINQAKKKLEALLARRKEELEMAAAMPSQATDFSLPGRRPVLGKCHPLTQVTEDIVKSFRKIGFVVADGPEIEDEYHCFDALNTPADHPARDSQDTFYIQSPERPLLRTHTSSVQIRVMENQPPPIRVIVPGRVYRRDTADATHNPTFHQIEGLYVDRGVTLGDLKGTVEFVFQELLGKDVKLRFRPHYFSYTEPSLEIDFSSSLTRKMGKEWLEIAGCGMVHPKVFDAVGYDPDQWSGWAFGFGIERIAMIRYGIGDIRLFYENDLRFLKQF
ncbi:MAG: phenylalanine--tRNA ligase subunit alpha [Limisphaerales bacterium]|jgi:phenylalanyl-tRNA synthetase alpha chain|nr:phenylalanine--tRNA ligase subunit alpha [Verrucomicrobiota bacterium]HCB99304.1 phenylalanine--tRNA ligase subunit alpha [Verrucomicrobiales bacterium]|tara:strand:- start:150 stop:1148 length:999 start_codon:yes stop_codon:yes gene_type:complete